MNNNTYIKQIYEEGLATTFYQKPKKYIEKNLEIPILKKLCLLCLNVMYIIFLVVIAYFIFKFNFPL